MPEGDTVWLTAHRLHLALGGRTVTTFDLRVPQRALTDLRGRAVLQVLARGKHILTRFDDGRTLHSHLRMDGSWQIAAAPAGSGGPPAEVRALIGNDEWLASGHRVHDLSLGATSDEHRWVGHLGPDLLGPDWDAGQAAGRLATRPDRPIVEALLDQRNLAGIGNMYAAELLFIAGVQPFTAVRDVADLATLGRTAFRLLRANRDHPEQSTTGSTRRGHQHWVYLRTGEACRRCRTPIRSAEFGVSPRRRRTYWCPNCQP